MMDGGVGGGRVTSLVERFTAGVTLSCAGRRGKGVTRGRGMGIVGYRRGYFKYLRCVER